MDAPLLALTRPRAGGLPGRSPIDAAAENMRQLVQLRWLAVAGQLFAILLAHYGLAIALPLAPMLAMVAVLALANLVFGWTLQRYWVVRGELLLALLLDMLVLTAQLYLSGGVANPFVALYLLQVVLGAILLSSAWVWVLVITSCLCVAFLSHYHLPLAIPTDVAGLSLNLILAGEWISFAMVATLLVLFITRISRNLRARDAYVAELAQRAVEEDGIVRMGLFASGAAHELATPLSSLSVLLADWQKDPELTRSRQVQEELKDAEAELERCKHILSNILHSAGQLRGEAMQPVPAEALIEELLADWHGLHSEIPLTANIKEIAGQMVAADPALRQALWSLLDNAAEESPGGIEVVGKVVRDRLVVAILDRGGGFAKEELDRVGRLYQSSKGPGHGLGLFLATNVARRLGGSLEVANRADGGASVRLLLPLASTEWPRRVEVDHGRAENPPDR